MRKNLKRFFSAVLAGIVCCTAITFYPVKAKAQTARPRAEESDIWEGVDSADWMSYLDDNLKISQINLPGTHDSGTKKVKLSLFDATLSAQCQDTTIPEQLNNGIRFLDIRMEDDGEKLRIVHGETDCKSEDGSNMYLDEVFQNCYDFLDAHPKETIVMSLKKDDGEASDADIERYIYNYINETPQYWYLQNGSPVLKDVRKKIVLSRRYHSGSDDYAGDKGVRLFWNDQKGDAVVTPPWSGPERVSKYGYLRFCVQDRYEYKVDNKWNAIQQGLDQPPHTTGDRMKVEDGTYINITPETTYFLNFMSTAGGSSPKSSAKTINANFLKYNNGTLERGKGYGWIIMDFATKELAEHVYKSNNSPKLEVASTIKALESSIPETVAEDLTLPSTGEEAGAEKGISITWACSPANILRTNDDKSTLVCPASGDVTAVLTATVAAAGGYSQQKEFTVQVKGMDAVFADLGAALREAEAFCDDPEYAKYNLNALKTAVETARKLVQQGADNVSNTQVNAATEALRTLLADDFKQKSLGELKENLLGWYPLTASSNDISGNHNNGTAAGVSFDKENGASFSGGTALSSYISLPSAMFNRTAQNDNLTISFWVKDDRGDNSNVLGFGASKACSSGKHFILNTNDGGKILASACPNGWGTDPVKIQTQAPAAGTWFHLVLVMEGKTFTLYKNGVEAGSVTEDYSLAEMGENVFAYIGNAVYAHNPYGGDKDFKGNIKDFRVYDCAIAPKQAKELYESQEETSGSLGGLLAHYPLTENAGDISGNGYDAQASDVTFDLANGAVLSGSGARSSYLSLPVGLFDQVLGNDNMTVSFWVRDDRGKNSNAFGFGNGTQCDPASGGSKHFIINTNEKENILASACPSGWGNDPSRILVPAPASGAWCHLTVVMKGKTMTLYKDGVKADSITEDYALSEMHNIAFAYIGNAIYAHNGDIDFKGNIRDFRIYDQALEEQDAAGLMGESAKEELSEELAASLGLEITKGEDGKLSMNVTKDELALPSAVGSAALSWQSSDPAVIDQTGKVTLPQTEAPAEEVTLTAAVTLANGKTVEVAFHCSVFAKADVDTVDLAAVVSSAEVIINGLNKADYTPKSWEEMQQALEAARRQMIRPSSPEAVQTAAEELQAKRKALAKLADKTELNTLIGEAEGLEETDYTSASWEAFAEALADAKSTAGDPNASQDDVDAAKNELADKKVALTRRADKKALEEAIQTAEQLSEEDYTPESWAVWEEILEGARQMALDPDAGEQEIAQAVQTLLDAMEALEKIMYTVTFDPDNGADSISVKVKKDETTQAQEAPQKEGYVFEGWFEEGAQEAFDFSKPITADITLTAKWTKTSGEDNPGGDNPGGDNPGGDNPGGNNPGGDNPGGDNPGGNNPGGDNPGGSNPGGDNPGGNNPGGDKNPGNSGSGNNENGQSPVSMAAVQVKLAKTKLTYTGKEQKPAAAVTYNGKPLTLGADYKVSYRNNKKVGLATVTILGLGRYQGQKSINFKILPKANKITQLTKKSGGRLVVKLKYSLKKTGAKGYEISYSTKKSFKGAKKVKTTKTSYTLKNLKKGKTYYVRVRPYAKIGKKNEFGAYSKSVKKKIS